MSHHAICSILSAVLVASVPGARHALGDDGSAAPQHASSEARKGGEPMPMDVEAKTTMKEFQRALADGDWRRALDYCHSRVRPAAGRYASPEEFFRAVVPVERIVLLPELPISSARSFPGKPGREGSFYGSFVRMLEGGPGLAVDWTWKIPRKGNSLAHGRTLPPFMESTTSYSKLSVF